MFCNFSICCAIPIRMETLSVEFLRKDSANNVRNLSECEITRICLLNLFVLQNFVLQEWKQLVFEIAQVYIQLWSVYKCNKHWPLSIIAASFRCPFVTATSLSA